jgi:hypothetical protein
MVEVVEDASELPQGSHALSLFVTQREAAETAADFLAGAPADQAASYWVADERLLPMYQAAVGERAPARVDSVQVLDGPQVQKVGPELRPVEQVEDFVREHPDGVTGAGETITWYWTPEQVPEYLEYEQWFQEQARTSSRFMCPYNLRDIPAADAPEILRALGARHSHLVPTTSSVRTARVLQLFVFPTASEIPGRLREELDWAVREGYVSVPEETDVPELTSAGQDLLVDWPD